MPDLYATNLEMKKMVEKMIEECVTPCPGDTIDAYDTFNDLKA